MAESKGYPLTTIAGIFNTTEVEVQRLADDGIIPRAVNGQYDLVACVRSYITYLREPQFLSKNELAKRMDLSERTVSDVLRDLALDFRTTPYTTIIIAYIRKLREAAAGRNTSDHQIDAAIARTRKDNMAAEMLEMQIKEKAGTLIPVSKVEPFITSLIIAARQQLINYPRKWAQELKAIHDVTVDEQYFEMDINDALNQLSEVDVFSDESDDASSDESLGSSRETADFAMGD